MKYRETGKTGKWRYEVIEEYSRQLIHCMRNAKGEVRRRRDKKLLASVNKGRITVYPEYTWDGATGYWDVECNMEATLVHDTLYQLIVQKDIRTSLRKCSDQQLYCIVKENGCPKHAMMMYNGLRGHRRCPVGGAIIGGAIAIGKIVTGRRERFSCS